MNKTSILAETLAEIQQIKEGIEKNANHVLKSTLKEDLEAIVRKGLNEAEEEEETNDMADDLSADQGSEGSDSEEMADGGDEFGGEFDGGDELPGDETELGEPEVIDLTDKTDDEVIQHFNLMKPADEIEIIQSPDGGIQINIKSSEEGGEEMGAEELPGEEEPGEELGTDFGAEETPADEEPGDEESGEEESDEESMEESYEEESMEESEEEENKEPVYEIEIEESEEDENVDEVSSMKHSEKHMKNEPFEEDVKHVKSKAHMKHTNSQSKQLEELQESLVNTRKKLQGLLAENKQKTKELSEMTSLVKNFKAQEAEYKSAIKNLKGTLEEAALFTSNLSYIVKLLSENTTTKDEKLSVIKRFDSAKTLNESREIFNSLTTLLNENKKSAEKTIEEQVLKTPKASGSSKLNESSAYKNPQLERMLDIIGKMK
jgi:hypothetical protein